ncbi:MAG: energy transducer TonB [Deltaproteobacteria bacterium]|nr:energy transducer TonB [Deltaproteobacteria bacterium]
MGNRATPPKPALRLTARWRDTIIDSALLTGPRPIRIGAFGEGAELQVDVPELLAAPLGSLGDESAEIRVPVAAKEIVGMPKVAPGELVRMSVGDRLSFQVRQISVDLQMEAPTQPEPRARFALPDPAIVRSFGITALLHVAFILTTGFARPVPSLDPSALLRRPPTFIDVLLAPAKKKPVATNSRPGGSKSLTKPGKAPGPRGPTIKPMGSRDVRDAGILGILKRAKGATGSIFDRGSMAGLSSSLAEVRGTVLASGYGGQGMGTRGNKSGGEGYGLGIDFGSGGPGRGVGCSGPDCGNGDPMLGTRGKARVVVPSSGTRIQGPGLDREHIASVIRKNHPRFRFCYEKRLNANPTLGGKVSIEFTIAPNGAVANASVRESSVGDDEVSECVAKVMRTLQFDQPKGGGVVIVTYPFVFTSSG